MINLKKIENLHTFMCAICSIVTFDFTMKNIANNAKNNFRSQITSTQRCL